MRITCSFYLCRYFHLILIVHHCCYQIYPCLIRFLGPPFSPLLSIHHFPHYHHLCLLRPNSATLVHHRCCRRRRPLQASPPQLQPFSSSLHRPSNCTNMRPHSYYTLASALPLPFRQRDQMRFFCPATSSTQSTSRCLHAADDIRRVRPSFRRHRPHRAQ